MRLKIMAVGTRMPNWVSEACDDYSRRLPRELRIDWHEIPLGKRGRGQAVARAVAAESVAMLAVITAAERVVALEVKGRAWSTPDLARQLTHWQMDGRDVTLLVGGPDGLGEACVERVDSRWSLSPLTLPHPLVRVLLAEQLYRAWTINQGHPYHR
jgi:23S rRNA (pseudouridine1915-N3)-methyltransferase